MNENLKQFLNKLAHDEVLAEEFKNATSEDEAYEIATRDFDGFTKKEFVDTMAQIKDATAELSIDDLDSAAGGDSNWGTAVEIAITLGPSCIVVGASSAAAI